MTVMKLATAMACIEVNLRKNTPSFLWGPPGVGKSQGYAQLAKKLGIGLIDFRCTLRDPVDLRGLPLIDSKKGTTRWLAPDELPNEARDGPAGILLLDELNAASQAMQTAAFGLVLDRVVGEYRLPKGWVPMAAGNRMQDRSSGQRVPLALRNRFTHYEVEADAAGWCDWALAENLPAELVAFIRFRPNLIHQMPKGDDNAFPTPRSWHQVANYAGEDPKLRQHLVAGLVGDGAAAEFEGFVRVWKSLPSFDEIIASPGKAKVPSDSEPAALYAVSGGLARKATRENFGKVLEYAARLPREFELLVGTDAIKHDMALKNTSAFAKWAVGMKEVVL